MADVPCVVGLEVAQARWASAVRPSGERGAVPHEADGVVPRVARVPPRPPTRRVGDATGGLERGATAAGATAGLPVVVGHPRQARDGARAMGPLAQTAALEARALAPCAAVLRPPPRPLPAAQTQARRARLGRRQHRRDRRPAAPQRLAGPSGRLAQDSAAQRAWLQGRRAPRDAALETRRRASPLGRAHDDRGPRVPGMGPGCARPLRLARPASGTRTRQPRAAWVGVAPLHGARGPLRGRRLLGGGRAQVCPVWSRGTRVATRVHPPRTAFAQRRCAAGKRTHVARTACRPQVVTLLKAMRQHRTAWQGQEGQNSKNIPGPLDTQDSCSARASLRLPGAAEARRSGVPRQTGTM
jgi:transposase